MTVSARAVFTGRETALFAAGSFGTGVFSTVPSVLLLYFCTDVAGIGPGTAALILFVPKLWTLFWDPFVGSWSDRTTSRFGRRRPFLLAGAFGTGLAFALLFAPPHVGGTGVSLWVAAAYFSLVTFYAFFAVPYVALPAEFAAAAADRSRLVGWRMSVAMIGVLAGAALAPALVAAGGGGRAGYTFMAAILGGACIVVMLCPLAVLRGRDAPAVELAAQRLSMWREAKVAASDRAFRWLVIAYIVMLAAAGVVSAAAPYLVIHAVGRSESDIGVALGVMLVLTSLTSPTLSAAGRQWGEARALGISIGCYVVAASVVAGAAHYGNWSAMLVGFALAGPAFAGLQVFPYTMVADLIHARAAQGGPVQGAMTGLWTAAEKVGLAIGPLLVGSALTVVGADYAGGLAAFVIASTFVLGTGALVILRVVAAAS